MLLFHGMTSCNWSLVYIYLYVVFIHLFNSWDVHIILPLLKRSRPRLFHPKEWRKVGDVETCTNTICT
jgi:hypothetical protein